MRELLYKIKQLAEGIVIDLHRHMLSVKHDTVLIVIYIRRILESPLTSLNSDRDDPMVLSGRMVQSACIAFIFAAELTLRIA